jgi:thiamine transport system substrate-binding protein
MKFHLHPLFFALFLSTLAACTPKSVDGPKVTVLTYSSLGSRGGYLESIQKDFKAKSACDLKIETTLGAAQILSYLEEPKQRQRIDLVMGIDELLYERARNYLYISPVASANLNLNFVEALRGRTPLGFYPIDYGALTFIYNKEEVKKKKIKVPSTLKDFLKPEMKHNFIVQDPRVSSPGLLFFLFSESVLKISELKKQWLTLAPSWDSSYKMFLQKDAPFVWSYLTSFAYHASKHEEKSYGYVDFKEGLPLQVEGLALVNRIGNPFQENPCDEKFIQYVLSNEGQTRLVEKQWMMPSIKDVPLPELFKSVPPVKKVASIPLQVDHVDQFISKFARDLQGDSF